METICLPDRTSEGESWTEEIDFLLKLRDFCLRKDSNFPSQFEMRLDTLSAASGRQVKGLSDDAFLFKPDGARLSLRRNFAFFPFKHVATTVSQADVYFTVSAILNNLRNPKFSERYLRNDLHHRSLLSPRCFDRFNDGIIQAAFLRTALPVELDYSCSEEWSGMMREIANTIFATWNTHTGEAILEFLFALGAGRLRLTKRDEKLLFDPSRDFQASATTDVLYRFVREVGCGKDI